MLFASDLKTFEDRSTIEQELDLTSYTTSTTIGKRQMRIDSKSLNIVQEESPNNNKRPRRS